MTISRRAAPLLLLSLLVAPLTAFSVLPPACRSLATIRTPTSSTSLLSLSEEEQEQELNDNFNQLTDKEKKKAVGNLVADDEWTGLSMELSELVRLAVVEDLKKNTRDFIGKDEYKIGDISKEIDDRVKGEVAKIRGKEEYELGDCVLAMDEMSKGMTEELTGKDYEPGDLSKELDKRVKEQVAQFAGKDTYEFGDLSREIDRRVKHKVEEFTGKPDYEFGDVSRELMTRRKAWVQDFLGDEAADDYVFGDITKKAIGNFTGKDEYQFGDVSKKIFGDLFGGKKKKKD